MEIGLNIIVLAYNFSICLIKMKNLKRNFCVVCERIFSSKLLKTNSPFLLISRKGHAWIHTVASQDTQGRKHLSFQLQRELSGRTSHYKDAFIRDSL